MFYKNFGEGRAQGQGKFGQETLGGTCARGDESDNSNNNNSAFNHVVLYGPNSTIISLSIAMWKEHWLCIQLHADLKPRSLLAHTATSVQVPPYPLPCFISYHRTCNFLVHSLSQLECKLQDSRELFFGLCPIPSNGKLPDTQLVLGKHLLDKRAKQKSPAVMGKHDNLPF